jgi:acyl dehydratase
MKLFNYLRTSFKIGDFVKETRVITREDLHNFSQLTGDHNPIHKNENPLVHGAFLNAIVAGIIGTKLPGSQTLVVSQRFSFPSKCYAEIPIEITVELVEVRKIIKVKYECLQTNSKVFEGEARLVMNKSKI